MVITWLGHATVLIELDGLRLLTDPVLSDRIGPLVRISAPIDPEVVLGIDAVLLSHLHADHADLRSLRAVARETAVFAPAGAGGWLRRRGLADVREIAPGDVVQLRSVQITATEAVHEARRRPLGAAAEPVGFLVQGSRSAYFAGDTDLFAAMAELRGRVDVALLPVAGWGPSVGRGHLDSERAAQAAAAISPALAIPIHWGTFALVWAARRVSDTSRPAREFAAITARAAPDVEVRVLAPLQSTEV